MNVLFLHLTENLCEIILDLVIKELKSILVLW